MDEVIVTADTRMVDSFILTLDRNEDEENWKREREREREIAVLLLSVLGCMGCL